MFIDRRKVSKNKPSSVSLVGMFIMIYTSQMSIQLKCLCRLRCRPLDRGVGMPGADFILYVVIRDDPVCGAARFVGFGGPCEKMEDAVTGRPLAGLP